MFPTSIASSSVVKIPKKIAGPAHLPRLLALLPKGGRRQLVQPLNSPPGVFYLVTRSRLKFTTVEPKPVDPAKAAAATAAAAVADQPKETLETGAAGSSAPGVVRRPSNPLEGGTVQAHGKAWGMLFRNGKFARNERGSIADPEIKGGLKNGWIALNQHALDPKTQAAIKAWQSAAEEIEATQAERASQLKKRFRRERKVAVKERQRIEEVKAENRKEMVKVKVLY